jgi:hypothetical protein
MPFNLDPETIRELAGEAPRFLSFGTVEDEDPVEFDPERGPLVNVALQPSRVTVRCRVGQSHAGAGEGEGSPFVAGDEVLVAMPSGPRGDCAVLCRLSNKADAHPTTVAGQDSSKNRLSYRRRRCAHFEEYEGAYAVFSQPSGAFLSLSAEGNVTLRAARDRGDGERETVGALQINEDMLGYQDKDGAHLLQLDRSAKRFTLRVSDSLLTVASGGPSALLTTGALSISTVGNAAHEHAVSTEAVANIVTNVLMALGAANPGPILGAALAGIAPTAVATGVSLAALAPLNPLVAAAVQAGFSSAVQKQAGVPGLGQSLPGIGCPGLMVG